MKSYQTDLEWQNKTYFVDGDVLEDGLFIIRKPSGEEWEFDPLEQPKWGITITDCWGEELEYADDDLVYVATQVLNALYWFELSLEKELELEESN